MENHVIALILADDEVCVAVVQAVLVDVMHYRCRRKRLPEGTLCNQHMLQHSIARVSPRMTSDELAAVSESAGRIAHAAIPANALTRAKLTGMLG